MPFDPALILGGPYGGWLLEGLRLSLILTAAALGGALPLGMLVALLRESPWRYARAIGWLYVEGMRNVPLLAHLLFWYFAFPEFLPQEWKEALYAGPAEAICASIGLALYAGAYIGEELRSGLRAVRPGQLAAARALGMSYLQAMRHVVLPQAVRHSIPPLLSQVLNLWKDTSIATVIGVGEMMYQAARVETSTFRSLEAFSFVTAAYLAVSLCFTAAAAYFRHRHGAERGRA